MVAMMPVVSRAQEFPPCISFDSGIMTDRANKRLNMVVTKKVINCQPMLVGCTKTHKTVSVIPRKSYDLAISKICNETKTPP